MRRLFERGQFFLSLILERDFFSLDMHHHVGSLIDKMLTFAFGRCDGEFFVCFDLG